MSEVTTKQRASKGGKRRNERNILTFYEKIAVIRYYDETNISRNSLAKMFHCCATQIRRILERKQELLQQLATLSEADASIILEEMTRKRRKFEMSAISFILHQWVERCRQLCVRKSITNVTLKETALKMAAILNLPSFRPSYRWLNRFRCKYKYNEEDLAAATHSQTDDNDSNTQPSELTVEDIIIEFKDALPSFMQKEISAVTATAKVDEKSLNGVLTDAALLKINNSNNKNKNNANGSIQTSGSNENSNDCVDTDDGAFYDNEDINDKTELKVGCADDIQAEIEMSGDSSTDMPNKQLTVGSAALLNSVFPHLAVIHQFALLNSDVKALELISQLGVHMQAQAAEGSYKQLTLANAIATRSDVFGGIYGDIDDIVLIE